MDARAKQRIDAAIAWLDLLQHPQYETERHDYVIGQDVGTVLDPYDPDVPCTIRQQYKPSCEVQHAIPEKKPGSMSVHWALQESPWKA